MTQQATESVLGSQYATGKDLMESVFESGSAFSRRQPDPRVIVEAGEILKSAFKGSALGMLRLKEAISTSDFQVAAFSILDREMVTRYVDIVPQWAAYTSRTTVKDFRPKYLYELLGGRAPLDLVPELTEFPARNTSKSSYSFSIKKFGGRFALSWESIINDELGELRELPNNLAVAARDTETLNAVGNLATATGPNPATFKAQGSGGGQRLAYGNLTNLPLTAANLEKVLGEITGRKDADGRPIVAAGQKLVVPPALEFTAKRILQASLIRRTLPDGVTQVEEPNFMQGSVELVVERWLPMVDKSATVNSTWYVVPDPNGARKALFLGFLRGYETPDLRAKGSGSVTLAGAPIAAEEGDFEEDGVQYRVRHVTGGAAGDPTACYASTGA